MSNRSVFSRIFRCLLILSLALSTGALASHSSPTLLVDAEQAAVSLDPHMEYLSDKTRALKVGDLVQGQQAFTSVHSRRELQLGYTDDDVWIKLEVRSVAAVPVERILEFEYAYLDRVTLYTVRATGIEVLHSGGTVPAAQRAIRHRLPLFPLHLAPGEAVTLYAHVQAEGSKTLNANLWQSQAFYEKSDRTYVVMAAYYGMLLALGLYNLLLYFGIRQVSFLLYSLFVFSFSAAVLAFNGVGPLFLWPSLGLSGHRILPVGFMLAATFAILFARSYLDTARYAPRCHRALALGTVAGVLMILGSLLLPLQLVLYLMSLFGILIAVMLFSCGVSCALKHVPGARIFVVAWLLLLLGTTMLSLRNLGVLPSNLATMYSVQVGSALEMLLLSFGLAARFNELKRQKELAQQENLETLREQEAILERRVASRTRELADANARLEEMATHDPLTGLANRSGLAHHLRSAMLRTARREETLALIMIDLDGFKPINDTHGHEAGDQLLQVVANRLGSVARSSDFVARFGGDEFIVVAEQIADQAAADALGERLRQAIRQPVSLDGNLLTVGASIGISLSDGVFPDAGTLLQQADAAMYRQKKASKLA
ncbi:7TM diverse intracellular signaling domain-containing protein [Pseudomonas borbori]